MIQLETRHQKIIQDILSQCPYQFYAYGSRAKGNSRKFSDLDLCYFDDIPLSSVANLREKFTESNLPFIVELVAWKNMRPAFQKNIQKDLVLVN